jgi:hypothetical protein
MMAENSRLSQPATEDQGGHDGSESKASPEGKCSGDGDAMWGDLIGEGGAEETPKKHVVLVMGSAGSGVLANAAQVLNRLVGDEAEGASAASAAKSVSSALVVVDLTQEFPERATRDGIREILARSDSENVVVAVITSAAGHVSITSVLSKMEACGCYISYSIAVVAAQSIENCLQSHSRFVSRLILLYNLYMP